MLLNILPFLLAFDLLLPFLLAPSYKGYNHLTKVMSALGNKKAPLHLIYNTWLVVFGVFILISTIQLYSITSKVSNLIAILLSSVLSLYAIGGCVLSGLFKVGETKSLDTLSAKIHGYGSAIGFILLTFAPLLISLYSFKSSNNLIAMFSLICFLLAIIFFVLFIMSDKTEYKGTIVSFEGLWQRLALLCMYLPIIALYVMQ